MKKPESKYSNVCINNVVASFSRLVEEDERKWTDDNVDQVALKHFPNIDRKAALHRPILYSNWLSKDYVAVEREELRDFVKARLKVRGVNSSRMGGPFTAHS